MQQQEQHTALAHDVQPSAADVVGTTMTRFPSIPARFEAQVQRYPQRVAIKTPQQTLTYAMLNTLANRVAWTLLTQHGRETEPVALLLEQGAWFVAALLGVLKAGKFFVPLDPAHPLARTRHVLEDSQARLLVTHTPHLSLASTLTQDRCHVLNIDALEVRLPEANPALDLTPDTLSSLLYTSGSTGEPKGVMRVHGHELHDVQIWTTGLRLGAEDRLTLLTSSTGPIKNVYSAILNGAALYSYNVREEGVLGLAAWLIREEITVYLSGAPLFRQILDTLTGGEVFSKLRLVRLGSDRVLTRDVERFRQFFPSHGLLVNALACTEAGNFRLYCIDRDTPLSGSTVPVGYAVAGKEVLLLDEAGHEVEVGQVGEIAVRSTYLARGYWRRPDLTQAAFQPDPCGDGTRIYRTGDLGRMWPDGCLEHLGRQDAQVKVRGYRVEVAEVERALLGHAGLREAVVLAREDRAGERCLVAYVVASSSPAPTVSALHNFLRTRLPSYMLPAAMIFLEALPLTLAGKVDRRALPPPSSARPGLAQPFVAPHTVTEEQLARIWAEVLGLDEVGVHDPFLELGGHSLLAMQIAARVRATWQLDVPVRALLEAPTVAQMAAHLVHEQEAQVAPDTLAQLLEEVETLSEEQTRQRLRDYQNS